jgi:hypothetical protein
MYNLQIGNKVVPDRELMFVGWFRCYMEEKRFRVQTKQNKTPANDVVHLILQQVEDIKQASRMWNSVEPERHCRRNTLDIARIPPDDDWIKINCDGAVVQYGLKAVCGGVIRVTNGKFVLGFSRNLRTCFITIADLWAMYQGLQLANDRGFPKIFVQYHINVGQTYTSVGSCW